MAVASSSSYGRETNDVPFDRSEQSMKYYFACPRCGNDERFAHPREQSSGLGCLILLFGGLIPALLFADAIRHRVQCVQCGFIFRQPALPRSSASRVAIYVILVVLSFAALTIILAMDPELTSGIPEVSALLTVEAFIAEYPRAVTLTLIPMLALLLLSLLVVSWVSNVRLRMDMRKTHKLKAGRSSAFRQDRNADAAGVSGCPPRAAVAGQGEGRG